MKFTKENFLENIKEVKKALEDFSGEELFEEEILDIKRKILEGLGEKTPRGLSLFKHNCYCLGKYEGNNIWLYDNEGVGIRDTNHLKSVLNKWKEHTDDYQKFSIFVVPVDVHS